MRIFVGLKVTQGGRRLQGKEIWQDSRPQRPGAGRADMEAMDES